MLPPRRPLNTRTPLTLHNHHAHHTKTPMLPPRSAHKPPAALLTPGGASAVVVNRALATPMSADGQTGRASIARLRSQCAGQVAAKARLFNAFATETTAPVEAEPIAVHSAVVPVLLPHGHHQRRQSAAYVLNNGRLTAAAAAAGRPSFLAPQVLQKIKANAAAVDDASSPAASAASPRRSMTPSGVNAGRRSTARNHLNGIHRRQKLRLNKTPIKRSSPMRLRHLIDDAAGTVQPSPGRRQRRAAQFRQAMEEVATNADSPRPRARKSMGGAGPQTPVKVLRHSPRLQAGGGNGSGGSHLY